MSDNEGTQGKYLRKYPRVLTAANYYYKLIRSDRRNAEALLAIWEMRFVVDVNPLTLFWFTESILVNTVIGFIIPDARTRLCKYPVCAKDIERIFFFRILLRTSSLQSICSELLLIILCWIFPRIISKLLHYFFGFSSQFAFITDNVYRDTHST